MIPMRIEGADLVLKPNPEQVAEGLDMELVAMTVDNWRMTKWTPSPAEIEVLVAGGEVVIFCWGTQPLMDVEVLEFIDRDDINPYVAKVAA